jgi:protein gp37
MLSIGKGQNDMKDKGISWTDKTWNWGAGCSKVSAGCRNCWALRDAWRLAHNPKVGDFYSEMVKVSANKKPEWSGIIGLDNTKLDAPNHWKKPMMIACHLMGDPFHEMMPWTFLDRVMGVIAWNKRHVFQILTKRPEQAARYFKRIAEVSPNERARKIAQAGTIIKIPDDTPGELDWPLPNLWLGVSAENQSTLDARMDILADIDVALRFVSLGPLLAPVSVKPWMGPFGEPGSLQAPSMINWVLVEGETNGAWPTLHPKWVLSITQECKAAGVPFHFKSWGSWKPIDMPWKQENPKPLAKNERWLNLEGGQGFHGDDVWRMRKMKPSRAGRLLYGEEYLEFPE